ncbi:unnamed protein product [Hyaloperonospora brassicae]|uniref:RxLR effector candidate protein n=1 Tax=Hyaloperonospora brassicae TaxID=162125 RepID=A0AAV0UAW1_HYABA|nr:unnamed protein product [Hyaloperonospora brassicae]CAI5732069.1 unnamed protein product [Hyaloperonospora brassicae]
MVAAQAPHALAPGRVLSAHAAATSSSKAAAARTERTLLLAAADREEAIHPLPWFLSPEWPKRPLPTTALDARSQAVPAAHPTRSACLLVLLCGSSAASSSSCFDAGSESELELGHLLKRPATSRDVDDEADSSKKCLQFLVGLLVTMALALVLLLVLQPRAGGAR